MKYDWPKFFRANNCFSQNVLTLPMFSKFGFYPQKCLPQGEKINGWISPPLHKAALSPPARMENEKLKKLAAEN